MTKQTLKAWGALAVLAALAVGAASVEAAEIRARVPFSFTVNGRVLPAGTYEVSQAKGVLTVQNTGTGAAAFAMTIALESREAGRPSLVFHRYGDEYFLRQAWTGGRGGRELPEPRAEREMANAARAGKVAAAERVVIPIS